MTLRMDIAGEWFEPLPGRALWRPARRALFVADLHLGKPAAFRAAGIPAPEQATGADLARLSRLLHATGAARLVILGDLLHARSGRAPEVIERVAAWRRDHAWVEIVLIRGNHDRSSGDPPEEWGIRCEDAPFADGGVSLRHEPPEPGERAGALYALGGHLHPAITLGAGPGAVRTPCFWFGATFGVLPAFGCFTGARTIRPAPGDRVVAAGDESVIDVSGAYSPSRASRMARI